MKVLEDNLQDKLDKARSALYECHTEIERLEASLEDAQSELVNSRRPIELMREWFRLTRAGIYERRAAELLEEIGRELERIV